MTQQEKTMLERFLQYGDLINSNIVFIGYEEGVGKVPKPHDVQINIKARELLRYDAIYKQCRVFINGIDDSDGWYINNGNWNINNGQDPLTHAIYKAILQLGYNLKWSPPNVNVINMQTRFHWLLQGTNRTSSYSLHNKKNYKVGYALSNGRHMIDYYPFPKRGKNSWDNVLNSTGIGSKKAYYKYYDSPNNDRIRILSSLYEELPMNITIAYLGIRNRDFLLRDFFQSIGFVFNKHNTNVLPNGYNGPIQRVPNGRDFLFGSRIREKDNHKQIVILTPFLGNGQISYADIDVISTWL
jgi:hypothetical protein